MPELDIFSDDAFSVRSLTTAINKLPFMPKKLGSLNLFKPVSQTTTLFSVEEQNGKLSLIPASARGVVPTAVTRSSRKKRPFETVHLPQHSAILADEVQGIRRFGSETEVESVASVVADLQQNHKDNIEVTKEWQRIGAIQGVVLDADGTTEIVNLFDAFSISEVVRDVNFTTPDDIFNLGTAVIRAVENALGADTYSTIVGLCGNNYWDALVRLTEVKDAFNRPKEGAFLRTNLWGQSFEYAGITWANYRGSVGSQKFLPDTIARFFPTGTQNTFEEHIAPAPFNETVNTRGQAFYSKQEKMKFDLGIELYSCSDVLEICARPGVLVKSTGTFA